MEKAFTWRALITRSVSGPPPIVMTVAVTRSHHVDCPQILSSTPLGCLASRSSSSSGDSFTLNQAATDYSEKDMPSTHGASYRHIVNLGEPEKSQFIVAPGQSGHPFSDHYSDLLDDWFLGNYMNMTLTLTPEEKSDAVEALYTPN